MSLKRSLALIVVLALVAGLLAGCGSKPAQQAEEKKDKESATIKIGVGAPLTGSSANDGQMIRKGAELAAELANKAGGLNGRKFEIVPADDKSDPKEGAAIANKFASDPSILAVVGHYNSSVTLAGAPIYNKGGVVEISPGSSSPAVSGVGPFTFRTVVTDAFQGKLIVEWATKDLGFKTAAVVFENDDYGRGLKDVFTKEFTAAGGKVLVEQTYMAGETTDFSAILTKIKEAKPDVILLGGLYNETALIAKQMKNLGFKVPIMGSDGLYSDALMKLGGEAVEGIMMVGAFDVGNPDPVVKEFVKAFREKYNEDPNTFAAFSYDAAKLVIEGLKKYGPDRKSPQKYLKEVKDWPGVSGRTTFNDKGDTIKPLLKLVVKNGKFAIWKK
ncbi:MAG: ABC transporter substrate-binding protein [Actinobacteria bacterium]|nr:ABC transporter substrate-binding protein [Actinomycetota bacterium]